MAWPTDRFGVWQVVWRNRYVPRPEGFPEVMLRIATPLAKGQGAGSCPPEIDEHAADALGLALAAAPSVQVVG